MIETQAKRRTGGVRERIVCVRLTALSAYALRLLTLSVFSLVIFLSELFILTVFHPKRTATGNSCIAQYILYAPVQFPIQSVDIIRDFSS